MRVSIAADYARIEEAALMQFLLSFYKWNPAHNCLVRNFRSDSSVSIPPSCSFWLFIAFFTSLAGLLRHNALQGRDNFDYIYKPLVDAWAHYDNSGPHPVLIDEEER